MHLRDLEDEVYGLKNKSRSLQSQVSKKSGYSADRNIDEEIDKEISTFIKKDGDFSPVHLPGREVK